MAIKTLIFGVDEMFPALKPFYDMAVQRGEIDIVAYAAFEPDGIKLYPAKGGGTDIHNFKMAIISAKDNFYVRMKMLEGMNIPRNRIIDGKVFKVPHLNFKRLLKEGIAYGVMDEKILSWKYAFPLDYKRIYKVQNSDATVSLGLKTYINGATMDGDGSLSIGNFCSISSQIDFYCGNNVNHNYKNISHFSLGWWGWDIPTDYFPNNKDCRIDVGNDVWIGRGSVLKSNNPDKPLVIGDGAVIAADSVVVKSVPPYAIVGGNPAQVIKYRFSDKIIESLLRIKWWDWDINKIHDNFQYFNRVEEFVEMHDKT